MWFKLFVTQQWKIKDFGVLFHNSKFVFFYLVFEAPMYVLISWVRVQGICPLSRINALTHIFEFIRVSAHPFQSSLSYDLVVQFWVLHLCFLCFWSVEDHDISRCVLQFFYQFLISSMYPPVLWGAHLSFFYFKLPMILPYVLCGSNQVLDSYLLNFLFFSLLVHFLVRIFVTILFTWILVALFSTFHYCFYFSSSVDL